jgi:uncharacterized membrane protein YqjE
MQSPELFTICISAFLAVFVLLAVLALVMRIIIVVFPTQRIGSDAATGTKVTKVEEIK